MPEPPKHDSPSPEISPDSENLIQEEPFPCPACGQMLAPSCRVCVACKHPIDPAEIRRSQTAASIPLAQPRSTPVPPVKFPWRVFIIVLALWIALADGVLALLGLVKGNLALSGVQILTSVWVFYDALHKGLPKPLRWGLGSMLLWPIIFPWYLARRRRAEAPCSFVEGPAGPFTRALLLLLLLGLFVLMLLSFLKGPLQP